MQICRCLKTLQNQVRLESEDSPEVEPTLEAQDEVASNEAQDGSHQANQSKNTFKYKSSHPEDLFIGNKESPRRIISYF